MNTIQMFENRIAHNRSLNRAARSTHIIWAKSYPTWNDRIFENPMMHSQAMQSEIMPILHRYVNGEPGACTNELVALWAAHMPHNALRQGQWHAELLPLARDFLRILQGEFEYERQRWERSIWFKLWHGDEEGTAQPVAVAAGS